MENQTLTINDENSFFISDPSGNIPEKSYYGIFFEDSRHLGKMEFLVDGKLPEVLGSRILDYNQMLTFFSNRSSEISANHAVSLFRHRIFKNGVQETIEATNNGIYTTELILEFIFDSDFADIFEVKRYYLDQEKSAKPKFRRRKLYKKNKQLILEYKHRRTEIGFNRTPTWRVNHAVFKIKLRPKETKHLCLFIAFTHGKTKPRPKKICTGLVPSRLKANAIVESWNWSVPKLTTDWDDLAHAYHQSIFDLASLKISNPFDTKGESKLLAAGLPWFMAVFGRDSLITAYQTISLGNQLAQGTLKTLADSQGNKINLQTAEQPGKIIHEMRHVKLGRTNFPYYGTVDATPLFLLLVSEYYNWTGDKKFVGSLKTAVLKALKWIDDYGDFDGDGFVEYGQNSQQGFLLNQNWRDSADSMVDSKGNVAKTPIASADVQGYVYDAKLRMAQLAKNLWQDRIWAKDLHKQAKELKTKFNQKFWVSRKNFFALGLDKNKKPLDTPASSMGHLLWSGIVEAKKISLVEKNLFSKELYSGWGVRTISSDNPMYNPVSYHRGSVWPHDNSLIVAGLMRAGRKQSALKLMKNIIEASKFFNYRLPEVFAGYSRNYTAVPVEYPTSASPQAWAAGAVILFLQLLFGITPDYKNKTLKLSPNLPSGVSCIKLDGVSAFGKHFVVEVGKKKVSVKEVTEWVCEICNRLVDHTHRHHG